MRELRSASLILLFMSYYLIAISCPELPSARVRRSLAIYVDRSNSMILGVGVLWPGLRRRCCCNRTTTPAPAVPRSPLPTDSTGVTITPSATTAPTPTSPAVGSPSDPPANPSSPPAGGDTPETTPPETVTVSPAPGSQLRRSHGRGLRVHGLRKQRLEERCVCSTRQGYRQRGKSAADTRLVVRASDRKSVKLPLNSTSAMTGSQKREVGKPVHRKKECIFLFGSRIYCTPVSG